MTYRISVSEVTSRNPRVLFLSAFWIRSEDDYFFEDNVEDLPMSETLVPFDAGRVRKKITCLSVASRGREMASRKAHNLEIGGSNPPPATNKI